MATLERAYSERQRGRLDAAEKSCREIVDADPRNGPALNLLGALCLETGRASEAEKVIRKALEIDAESPDALNNLGLALGATGRPHEAQHFFARAIVRRPNFVEAYYNLGLALQACGQADEAMAVYRRAIEIRPAYAEALNNLALIHHGREQLQDAAALYRRALMASPDLEITRTNLATALLSLGERDEAERELQTVFARNPNATLANYALAQIDFRAGDAEASTAKLHAALDGLLARLDWLGHAVPELTRIKTYNIARYREALVAVTKALDAAGIEFSLLCGTLLGAIRDRDIISFDKDIDLGIDAKIAPAELDAALTRDPRFARGASYDERLLPSYFFEDYTPIDFFRLYSEGETIWYGLNWYGHEVRWRHARFDLIESEFLGVKVKIPADPERHLTEVYADWRTPNPYFGAWSSPNMDGGFPAIARCMAYGNIVKAAWSGDRARAASLCTQFLALDSKDARILELARRLADGQISTSAPERSFLPALDDPFDDPA